MNKHILMTMDSLANPGKYTIEQLKECSSATTAASYYAANYAVAYAVDAAAYYAVSTGAADACVAYDNANYWLYIYFKRSGENKQDYIDEINKD